MTLEQELEAMTRYGIREEAERRFRESHPFSQMPTYTVTRGHRVRCLVRHGWECAKRTRDGKIKSKKTCYDEECGDRKRKRTIKDGKRWPSAT